MQDRCAFCSEELFPGVADRMWELMTTTWGRVCAGNYCRNGKCEPRAYRVPEEVAAYLALRQATDDRWEA